MPRAFLVEPKTPTSVASLSAEQLTATNHSQALTIADLKKQIEWFQRQIFGSKVNNGMDSSSP